MTPIPAPGSISRSSSFPLASQTSLLAGQCISSKLDFGAKADVVILNDGVIFASTSNLASETYVFQDSDVGKLCFVYGVGSSDGTSNIPLAATITSIVAGNAQLSASATITGIGVMIVFGTDDTTACQAFLDAVVAVSAYGLADFQNLTYMVSALQVPSNIIITNANFIMLPGATRLLSPLTIDGRTISPYFQTPKTNITIRNVTINGLRHMQWGMATGPSAEDGGNHGVRMLGFCSNILLDRVFANYCATDGLCLISYGVATVDTPSALAFQRIRTRDCQFNFNRRHGFSGDSFGDVEDNNSQFFGNSLSLNFCYDTKLGDRAAPDRAGNPYGTGIWWEDNTSLAGGGSARWVLRGSQSLGNWQRAVTMFTHAGPFGGSSTDLDAGGYSGVPNPGFLPRNFQAYDCTFDAGLEGSYGGTYTVGPIVAVSNASAAVFTLPSGCAAPATAATVTVSGFTGAWAAANGSFPATNLSGNSFSIPVDSSGFGSLAGNPGFWGYAGGSYQELSVQVQADDGMIANLITVTGAISAATNANPVVFTVPTAPGTATMATISGFTGTWAAANGTWPVTELGPTTFSIPVDSSGFGGVTGSGAFSAPNVCGVNFSGHQFVNNYVQGRVAWDQIYDLNICGNDIKTSVTFPLSNNGELIYQAISLLGYDSVNTSIGPNNLHGGQTVVTFTNPDGTGNSFTPSGGQMLNAFNKVMCIRPYPLQLLPNDVSIGGYVTHGADPVHANQLKMWDGTGWFSVAGSYNVGGVQLQKYAQGNTYIIGASWTAGVATFETSDPHGVVPGDAIAIRGILPAGWNCSGYVHGIPDSTHIEMDVVVNPGSYVAPVYPGNNGVQFNIYPGGGDVDDGYIGYDPLLENTVLFTPHGWRTPLSRVIDFCNDIDYNWDNSCVVDYVSIAPVTADRNVYMPLQANASTVQKTFSVINAADNPHNITIYPNTGDPGRYIGANPSFTLPPNSSVILVPDSIRLAGSGMVFRGHSGHHGCSARWNGADFISG